MGRGFVSSRRDVPVAALPIAALPIARRDATLASGDICAPIDPRARKRQTRIRDVIEPGRLDLMAGSNSVAPKRITPALA